MNKLRGKGMSRTAAYKKVQVLSFKTVKERRNLKDIVTEDSAIRKYLSRNEIEKVFDLKWFLRNIKIR